MKKQKLSKGQKITFAGLLILSVFSLGLFLGLRSWDQNLYVSWKPLKTGRGLAEESSEEMVLNLSSNQLLGDMGSGLFEDFKVIEQDAVIQFYLKNLLIPNEDTEEYAFLCEVFSFVEFRFVSLGISLSGEPGLMFVQSPCRSQDIDFIGPFFIPKGEILSRKGEKAFTFEETFIRFYKASIILTPRWLLKSLRFFNKDHEEEFLVSFNPQEHEPLEIPWNE